MFNRYGTLKSGFLPLIVITMVILGDIYIKARP